MLGALQGLLTCPILCRFEAVNRTAVVHPCQLRFALGAQRLQRPPLCHPTRGQRLPSQAIAGLFLQPIAQLDQVLIQSR